MEESTEGSEIQYQPGDTITISLEDATQLMQGIEGGVLPPGTYHILTQEGLQIADDTVDSPVGFTVVQSVSEDVSGLQDGQIISTLQSNDPNIETADPCSTIVQNVSENEIEQNQEQQQTDNQGIKEESPNGSPDERKAETCDHLQMDKMTQQNAGRKEDGRSGDKEEGSDSTVAPGGDGDKNTTEGTEIEDSGLKGDSQSSVISTAIVKNIQAREDNSSLQFETAGDMQKAEENSSSNASQSAPAELHAEVIVIPTIPDDEDSKSANQDASSKRVDLSQPITVTNETEITINGKKCILRPNPFTGELCAYPVLPPEGKKRRGRPPKKRNLETESNESNDSVLIPVTPERKVDPVLKEKIKDQANAAEGLLELSNTGPDGVRRSGRARKKAKTLDDYEVTEVSSDDDGSKPITEDDSDATKEIPCLRRKFKSEADDKEIEVITPFITPTNPVKRGRGRPRRYPPPGQTNTPTQIPAVIIPGANGQTLMMAPIQGLSNFQAFQEQMKNLPEIISKTPSVSTVTLQPAASNSLSNSVVMTTTSLTSTTTEDLQITNLGDSVSLNSPVTDSTDTVTMGTSVSEDASDVSQAIIEVDNAELEGTESSSEILVMKDGISTPAKVITGSSTEGEKTGESTEQTIIQIPENLLPMFLPKNNPVKLGLKFSEKELDDLRCPKCGYQAFYPQQYQTHIANHVEETQKCKCCSFVSFDKASLIQHFKENHPRCICSECDFMAEHAYVIKRHMMRHTAEGCTCDYCGKTYKDQYIMKMHVKMVHMPAEVLFECTVCSKKFTRKAHLKRHLRIHEPEKPFKCPHCEYRGCERSDISKHILIHEEPRHVCEVCGKAFRHLKNKSLHLKRHHGQRDYKCGVCDFFGYTFTDIRKHIERKHSEIKTYFCDKCGAVFKSEAVLREHQKQQCEVFMIEQALSIATSTGTGQATIQIPTNSLGVDGGQFINAEQVNIRVERVDMHEEDEEIAVAEEELTEAELTEEQIEETFEEGNLTISDAHVIEAVVSESHVIEQVSHDVIDSQGSIEVTFEGNVTEAEIIESVPHGSVMETSQEEGGLDADRVPTIIESVAGEVRGEALSETEGEHLVMEMT